jgi:hypothetical protein
MSTPINDSAVLSRAKRISDRSGAPRTRLRGRRLILARVAWLAVVSLLVVLFLARLPAFYTALQTVCTGTVCGFAQPSPDSALALQKLGFSAGAYAAFTFALTLALAFVCFTLGAVIFWRRSDDWMALLVALAVVATFTLNENVYGMDMNSAWGWPAMILFVFGFGMYLLVFSLFPDGRFVTRWARWLLLCWPVAVIHYFIFMDSLFFPLASLAALGLLMIAQVYHYRTAASPLQRQQTKWVIFGACVAVIIAVGLILLAYIFLSPEQAGSFYRLVITPAFFIMVLIVPLCLALAILRYRLYDIDLLINRTLVYGTLTVLLALVYFGLIFALQYLLRGIISQNNDVAIVISTLAIAALFQPLRSRIQAIIDRHFYRRKYDAARTLAAFNATIRDEVDLNQLGIKLMAVVEETMQPAHVSLWLCPPKRYLEETTRALPIIDKENGIRLLDSTKKY